LLHIQLHCQKDTDRLVFTTPSVPKRKEPFNLDRAKTLLEQMYDSEKKEALDELEAQYNKAKMRIDFLETIPYQIRSHLKYYGDYLGMDKPIELYHIIGMGMGNQHFIMADWNTLWTNATRNGHRIQNAGIHLKDDKVGNYIYHAGHKYPIHFIVPFVKSTKNKNGLIIGKRITTKDNTTYLFFPIGKATMSVKGLPI